MSLDLYLGAISVALGGWVYWYAGRYNIPVMQFDTGGGEVFPRIMSAGLIVCGIVVIASELRRRRNAAAAGETPKAGTGGDIRIVAGVIGSIVVYILILEKAGFIVTSLLLTAGLLLLQGLRDVKKLLYYSVGIVGVLYVLFVLILQVKMPTGLLI